METSNNARQNRLVERMVRNESIFCSLLFDRTNRTLRVVERFVDGFAPHMR